METFELLFFILIGIYSATVLSISIGLFRLPKSFKLDDIESLPTVAVIVSAKNEEDELDILFQPKRLLFCQCSQ